MNHTYHRLVLHKENHKIQRNGYGEDLVYVKEHLTLTEQGNSTNHYTTKTGAIKQDKAIRSLIPPTFLGQPHNLTFERTKKSHLMLN